jgi:hypothetical protein
VDEGLTPEEIRVLADLFTPQEAAGLLERAGPPRGAQPSWRARTARAFWTEVSTLITHGVTPVYAPRSSPRPPASSQPTRS